VAVTFGSPLVANGTPPVTTSCSPANGSLFPVGDSAVTCTATDADRRTSSCGFFVTVTAPGVLSVTRFVGFGDSITWGEDGSNGVSSALVLGRNRPRVQVPSSQRYEGFLQAELAARYAKQSPTVGNAGNPGESLLDSLTLPRFQSVLNGGAYDVVLIMEGTNDLSQKDAALEPAMMSVLRQMIATARSRGVLPYLATIPPMNPAGYRAATEYAYYLVAEVDDQIRALAQSQNVPLVDVYAALNTNVPLYIGPDGVHPTVDGYAKIADTFFASIQQTLERTSTVTTAASPSRTGSSAIRAASGQGSRVAMPTVR
jgi:lysophospholipase L1-like esterase